MWSCTLYNPIFIGEFVSLLEIHGWGALETPKSRPNVGCCVGLRDSCSRFGKIAFFIKFTYFCRIICTPSCSLELSELWAKKPHPFAFCNSRTARRQFWGESGQPTNFLLYSSNNYRRPCFYWFSSDFDRYWFITKECKVILNKAVVAISVERQ